MNTSGTSAPNVSLRVGLLGSTGYAGQLLHALIMQHSRIEVVVLEHREPTDEALAECAELAAVAMAVPIDVARVWAPALNERGVRVLDLSGAHRQLDHVHYGLPELMGAPKASDRLVANPGCYPTAALLSLVPLMRAGLIEPEGILVVGKSGTSGAGKGLRDDLHFSELFGNFFPYKVGEHRHAPEIERYLGAEVTFVPQLMPLVRGLMTTSSVRPKPGITAGELHHALRSAYEPHPYVTVLDVPGAELGVRHVVGSHQAVIAVGPAIRSGVAPVFASIDNVLRGAASQALHNLNLWLGLDPFDGLPTPLSIRRGVPGMSRAFI